MGEMEGERERDLEEGSLSPVPVIQDTFLCQYTLTRENYHTLSSGQSKGEREGSLEVGSLFPIL